MHSVFMIPEIVEFTQKTVCQTSAPANANEEWQEPATDIVLNEVSPVVTSFGISGLSRSKMQTENLTGKRVQSSEN